MKKVKSTPVVVKKMVEVEEVVGETTTITEEDGGFQVLLNKPIFIHGANYHYMGKLTGVNGTCIELSNAKVVFDTGSYASKKMSNAQRPHSSKVYIQMNAIEAFWEISDNFLND
jgi:hypothetical protein